MEAGAASLPASYSRLTTDEEVAPLVGLAEELLQPKSYWDAGAK